MYNQFNPIGEKIKEFIKKYYLMILLVLIIIIIIIVFLASNKKKNNSNTKLEQEIADTAIDYIENNNIQFYEDEIKFISFKEIDYQFPEDMNCKNNGGVLIEKFEEEYMFTYYYECKKYVSEPIKNIKENNSYTKEITLKGQNPMYIANSEDYKEPGYTSNNEIKIEDNIGTSNGIYYVSYIDKNNSDITAERMVIVYGNNNNEPEKVYTKPTLTLLGNDVINITKGESYIDPGCTAYDTIEGDITDKIETMGEVDTYSSGTYIVLYMAKNDHGMIGNVTRTINVIEGELPVITLSGDANVNLKLGESYVEPGYKATDSVDGDLTDDVIVDSNLNTNTAGIYTITYTVQNSLGNEGGNSRIIVVQGETITPNLVVTHEVNTTAYTYEEVTITLKTTGDHFSHYILPNGNESYDRTTTYVVSNNGEYNFEVYSTIGLETTETVSIKNIDKEAPQGECTYTGNGSYIYTVKAYDDVSGISHYEFKNSINVVETTTLPTYTSEIKGLNVLVYDKADNVRGLVCKSSTEIASEKEYDPIYPPSNANVIRKNETNSLILTVEKVKRSSGVPYYITRIWAKNPKMQLNKYTSKLGTKQTPTALMKNAIKQNKLQSKLIVGINATPSQGTGSWSWIYRCSGRKNQPIGQLYISNGKTLINDYDKKCTSSFTIGGINSNNEMILLRDRQSFSSESRKSEFQKFIDSGVRNTFTFRPSLVLEGKKYINSQNDQNSANIRQGICQINKNNFVFITDDYDGSSRRGFTLKKLAQKMIELGCQTGLNLDGGGSTVLYYQEPNKSLKRISGGSRSQPEMLYFTEL